MYKIRFIKFINCEHVSIAAAIIGVPLQEDKEYNNVPDGNHSMLQ